jgi:hypothetical protein
VTTTDQMRTLAQLLLDAIELLHRPHTDEMHKRAQVLIAQAYDVLEAAGVEL